MNPAAIEALVEVLSTSGPYGLVGVLAWVVWKKDKTLKEVYGQIIRMTEKQTEALVRVESILQKIEQSIKTTKESMIPKR